VVYQWPVDLEAYELVMLRRPENAPDYDDAELEREEGAGGRSTRDAARVAPVLDLRPVPGPALQEPVTIAKMG
jgi:hypothetical protein